MFRHLFRHVSCTQLRSLKLVSGHKLLLRPCSSFGKDLSTSDESPDPAARAGKFEPVWYWDEEEEKAVVSNKRTEHFSFDPSQGILQEPEDERLNFQKYVAKFGQARFSDIPYNVIPREFEMSRDPAEWEFVQRLLPPELVPPIPDLKEFPSGFKPPRIAPDSEEAVKIGYFVGRSTSHLLPVYSKYDRVRNEMMKVVGGSTNSIADSYTSVPLKHLTCLTHDWSQIKEKIADLKVTTTIIKCEGNLFKLRDDLDKFLYDRYHMKFNSRVTEIYSKVKYLGDFEVDFKDFLIEKGF